MWIENVDGEHVDAQAVRIYVFYNDSDSFEKNTRYWDMGSYLVVRTVYRGRNSFGALVKNAIKAKVDAQTGRVIEIMH